MAFNFPASPTIGQIYTYKPGVEYVWTGAAWDRISSSVRTVMAAGVVTAYAGVAPPPGALWCDGATFDETQFPLLYKALGDKNKTPDLRGRTVIGKDDMGGTAAGRVTNTGTGNPGIDALTLFATGGVDRYAVTANQMPVHAHSVTDNGHSHALTDPGHNHGVNDPGHAHSVYDPSHNHGFNDPWHNHPLNRDTLSAPTGAQYRVNGPGSNTNTSSAGTGCWNSASGTGIGIYGAGTGIYLSAAVCGITMGSAITGLAVNNSGGGEAHPNVQPSMVLNMVIWTGQ